MRQGCELIRGGGGADASIGPRAIENLGTTLRTAQYYISPTIERIAGDQNDL